MSRPEEAPHLRTAVAGWVALAVAMGIGRFAFTPLLPMMQEDQAVSVAAGGWLASANYFGYLVGALVAIRMHVSAVTLIRWSLLCTTAVTVGMAMTGEFALWMALRFAAGVLSAWVLVSTSAWSLARLSALGRAGFSGLVFGGVGTGIALAGIACLALMQADAGSRSAWVVMGAAALLLTLAIWPLFSAAGAAPAPMPPRAGYALGGRASLRLILCYGASGFGYIVPATFLPVMAKAIIADPLVFGWSWPVFGIASLASTLAAGALLRSLGSRRVWQWSHALMAAGVIAPVILPGLSGIALSAVLVGGTFMVSVLGAFAQARELAGEHAAALIAAMTACYAFGQLAGPVMVSLLGGRMDASLLAAATVLAVSVWGISKGASR